MWTDVWAIYHFNNDCFVSIQSYRSSSQPEGDPRASGKKSVRLKIQYSLQKDGWMDTVTVAENSKQTYYLHL